jgi:hypothetical protein
VNEPTADTPPTATYGDVVKPRSLETSKAEQEVRQFLHDSGYPITAKKAGILCHHPEQGRDFLTLTPDIVIEDWRLAIEVDPCAPSPHGYTHAGTEEVDRLRNDLLADVGWSVIRLRLGASKGGHIGDRDVVVESGGFTKAAKTALVEALDDFKSAREPQVRFVPKSASPKPAQRRSHVVNIGEYRYADGGHIFSWYPTLHTKEKVTLRLCLNGRFLYTHGHRVPRFIAEVGLHEVPREGWKDRLTDFLRGQEPEGLGTTKWPWGDTLFVIAAGHSGSTAERLVEACEHEKHTIDREDFWFTTSGHEVQRWHQHALLVADDVPIVEIHPDAVALGYRFVDVTGETGRYGPYQRIFITRAPQLENA